MRILHVLDHSLPKHSGYVFRTMNIVRQQKAMGWDPILVTTPRHGASDSDIEEIEGWTFYRSRKARVSHKAPAGIREIMEMRRTTLRLKALIKDLNPDIVHAHSPVLNFFPAAHAAGNRPTVYEIRAFWEDAAVDHGSTQEGSLRYRFTRYMETRAIRRATMVTTICEGLRSDIVTRGIPEDKVTVIPNAVNVEAFQPITARDASIDSQLGLKGKTVLAFIGSFYAYEGLEFLIRTLPKLIEVNPETVLLLVGGGPSESAMKQAVTELGLDKHVIFTGRVPHSDVNRYYSVADIMVYPRHSIRLTETVTPLKPLEAMALKRLVLASNIGGHRELIEDGKTGFMFNADDADGLQFTYKRLLDQRDTWADVLSNGRHFVEDIRSWKNSVARYQGVYEKCLEANR